MTKSVRGPRPAGTGRIGLALACLALVYPVAPAAAWRSDHQSVELVWSVDGAECDAVALAPAGDGLWSAVAAAPLGLAPGSYAVQFQFMIDGSMLPAHYGQDITRPDGVVLAANPPNILATIAAPGYTRFTLDEMLLRYEVAAAAGLVRISLAYEETPSPYDPALLESTHADVRDLTADVTLGTYGYSAAAEAIPVARLLPGRVYELAVSAPGYVARYVEVNLQDDLPFDILVTLQKLVPAEPRSWGGLKVLYH